MQKISSYLYPNRIILTADLAGSIPTEYTNVYQRTIKIYRGVPNVLEFDIINADQKRIDLSTVTSLSLNVMDTSGNGLPNSPYTITPNTPITGLSRVTIPAIDIANLKDQYLQYSVTAVISGVTTLLYGDTRFGATGTIEIMGSAAPTAKTNRVYDTFTGEIDFAGNVMHHSSAIPAKFYEAVATTNLTFAVDISSGFAGTVYVEGTTDMTISINSWLNATKTTIFDNTSSGTTTSAESISSLTIPVANYNYFRVTWQWPSTTSISSYITTYDGYGADNGPGKVVSVTVS